VCSLVLDELVDGFLLKLVLLDTEELALVRVVEAIRRVAGAGDTEGEQHLPPLPRPEPLPGVGAQLEHGLAKLDRLEERKRKIHSLAEEKATERNQVSMCATMT
jgi:hypothetical protein